LLRKLSIAVFQNRGSEFAARPDWLTSGAFGGGSSAVLLHIGEPLMTKSPRTKGDGETSNAKAIPTKQQQVIDLFCRKGGATLEEKATLATWLPHSTRAIITGLKKKGFAITSKKVDDVRRYRAEQKAA
jgi:Protein of unknown function (DUF3489)